MDSKKIINARDAAMMYGTDIFPHFNLDDLERFNVYKAVYERFVSNIISDKRLMKDQKAVLLIGPKGTGKSICMKVMQKMFKDTNRKFKWASSLRIKDMVVDGVPLEEIKELFGAGFMYDLYIDDLGFGAVDQNQFGNLVNIMAELIYDREELYVKEKILTHFSTNLLPDDPTSPQTIKKFYGDRSHDRVVGSTEIFVLNGKTLRHNNDGNE